MLESRSIELARLRLASPASMNASAAFTSGGLGLTPCSPTPTAQMPRATTRDAVWRSPRKRCARGRSRVRKVRGYGSSRVRKVRGYGSSRVRCRGGDVLAPSTVKPAARSFWSFWSLCELSRWSSSMESSFLLESLHASGAAAAASQGAGHGEVGVGFSAGSSVASALSAEAPAAEAAAAEAAAAEAARPTPALCAASFCRSSTACRSLCISSMRRSKPDCSLTTSDCSLTTSSCTRRIWGARAHARQGATHSMRPQCALDAPSMRPRGAPR